MKDDKLSVQSMDFAVSIIELVKSLKEKRESIISNQIGRSGTSIRVMLISSINTSKQGSMVVTPLGIKIEKSIVNQKSQ